MKQTNIGLLERELQERDFSNSDNPLFDLSDERIKSVYQKLQKDTKAEATSRDTTSWEEIKECVEAHVSQYGDGALVIISGAAPHIWGAIPYLEQKIGAKYISATSHKLGVDLAIGEDSISNWDKKSNEQKVSKALDTIKVQIKRDLGVARKLGYDTIEDYITDRSNIQNPRNVIFGAEETGLHGLYFGERKEQLYTILLNFIKNSKTTSILYTGEDLNVKNMRKSFENDKLSFMGKLPRDKIFDYAKSQKIPVEFGAFGHRDRQSYRNFGYRSEQSFQDSGLNGMIGLRNLYKF